MQDTLVNIWNQMVAAVQSHPQLAYLVLIGLVAGWLASLVLGGGGLFRDMIIGVLGAFVGTYLVQVLDIHLPGNWPDWLQQIAVATGGAILIIIIGRVIFR